jgi:hypothetical protein
VQIPAGRGGKYLLRQVGGRPVGKLLPRPAAHLPDNNVELRAPRRQRGETIVLAQTMVQVSGRLPAPG